MNLQFETIYKVDNPLSYLLGAYDLAILLSILEPSQPITQREVKELTLLTGIVPLRREYAITFGNAYIFDANGHHEEAALVLCHHARSGI